jgi:hypothetical protein
MKNVRKKRYIGGMKKKAKLPKVVYRKLGREHAHARIIFVDDVIEIDPRQTAIQEMDSIIHEVLHRAEPTFSESRVIRLARQIRDVMWDQNYRKVKMS